MDWFSFATGWLSLEGAKIEKGLETIVEVGPSTTVGKGSEPFCDRFTVFQSDVNFFCRHVSWDDMCKIMLVPRCWWV